MALGVEKLWENYFKNSMEWWDNRNNKLHSKSPDFRHKTTKEGLWIDSWNTPLWVAEALDRKALSATAGGGSYKSGTELRNGYVVHSWLNPRDQFAWNALISQYAKCGQGRQALGVYDEMREAGVEPSSYTFVAALKACRSLHDLESGKQIHAHLVESGFELNVFVGSMLVDLYAKCGSLVDARRVFEKIPHRNVVSWTAMILGYAQMEDGEEALHLYTQMQEEGVVPDDRTFVGALKACATLLASKSGDGADGIRLRERCLEQVKVIHSDIVKTGYELDVFVGTMLVDVYAKCWSLVEARRIFDKMPQRDVVSWTAMIIGYAQMEDGDAALGLYAQMQQEGVVPDNRTFVGALKACCSMAAWKVANAADEALVRKKCLEQVRTIHSHTVKSGFETDLFVGTMLLDAYAKCWSLVDARFVFERMTCRNVVSWNAMLLGYAQTEDGEEALQLYARMQEEGVAPDEQTFVGTLKACSSLAGSRNGNKSDAVLVKKRCLKQVRAIHMDILMWELESDVFLGTMLVDVYAKCESLVDARHVFEKMPQRDVASWNAMILGYAQLEDAEVALELYQRMQHEGFLPNARTFIGALKACGVIAGLEKGKEVHSQVSVAGITASDIFVSTALIDMYGKCGSMENAQKVFDELPTRDAVTWNALIAGYAHQGDSESVMNLFLKMREQGTQPTSATFVSVLTVCSHVGLLDMGREYFEAMSRDYSITPTLDHYTCMLDLLGRAGEVDDALDMVTTMPLEPDGVVWSSLLAACQKWRSREVGNRPSGLQWRRKTDLYVTLDVEPLCSEKPEAWEHQC